MDEKIQGFPPSFPGAAWDDETERDNNAATPMDMDGKPTNSECGSDWVLEKVSICLNC
jgi:hypothetical protein